MDNKERNLIERIKKTAFAVILGSDYGSYRNALSILNMETLGDRCHNLCVKLAQKSMKHEKYNSWFCINEETRNTRTVKPELKKTEALKKRYEKSPLYYLTNLLNEC